jgi:hypothetical protein
MEEDLRENLVPDVSYSESNCSLLARICSESVENMSKMTGNIFSVSCNVGT